MKNLFLLVFLGILKCGFAQPKQPQFVKNGALQLATPILKSDQTFFKKEAKVALIFGQENADIRYTLDGSEPTEQSLKYESTIVLKNTTQVKAKAFHACCQPSEIIAADFFKMSHQTQLKSVNLVNKPHENYRGEGATTLVNLEKGTIDFKDGKWLGFDGKDAEIILQFTEKTTLEELTISTLSNTGAWIFSPKALEVYQSRDGQKFEKIITKTGFENKENSPAELQFLTAKFPATTSQYFKVIVKNQGAIPDWHVGKGSPAWLFLDEIFWKEISINPHQHPIPFNPEQYVCYRTDEPMVIDGKATENSWKEASWTKEFVDIEGDLKPKPYLKTQTKMLWDDTHFYFFAKLEEPHIWAKLKNRDDIIFYDDDFEIFIDPDGDSHHYYEIEINALNTVWDLWLDRPYRVDRLPKIMFEWNISNMKTAVNIHGTLNNPADEDAYWTVEIAIPWKALKEFAPKKKIPKSGDQWRLNFSRVDWYMKEVNGDYEKVIDSKTGKPKACNNWVWSPTGRINMHMPETWGYVQFSEKKVGSEQDIFVEKPDEAIKWALWNLYFQQLKFYKKNQRYSKELADFSIPKVADCKFDPVIYTTPYWFEIVAKTCKENGVWRIRKDGEIRRVE